MWNVVTKDNKNYPDTDRFVVGFFIEGADPFVDICQYLKDFDIWVDDSDNVIDAVTERFNHTNHARKEQKSQTDRSQSSRLGRKQGSAVCRSSPRFINA